ncbi:MAG TPA: PQQ-binding-like beta-propeller repeat protein, partial [Gemmatales bacterium]|nr:PQQ-binding-like beta-propeller repeat protein [Gemmatales bacterium]
LLHDGLLYIAGTGVVTCYNAATGEEVWKERLPGARGFTSSPWAAGGKLYFLDEDGQTFILAAGPKFQVLGKNSLGEMCWSSPAIADGAIYLRTVDHVFCIK